MEIDESLYLLSFEVDDDPPLDGEGLPDTSRAVGNGGSNEDLLGEELEQHQQRQGGSTMDIDKFKQCNAQDHFTIQANTTNY